MKYDQIEEFSDEQFRRLTGVKRSTFKKMIEILREADHKKKFEEDVKASYRLKIVCLWLWNTSENIGLIFI